MWKVKVINWLTNIFGTVAGVPEILSGVIAINNNDIATGIMDIMKGVGILAIGYFTGKSVLGQGSTQTKE